MTASTLIAGAVTTGGSFMAILTNHTNQARAWGCIHYHPGVAEALDCARRELQARLQARTR